MSISDVELISAKLSLANLRDSYTAFQFTADLSDDALFEILVRLSDARAAIQCSVVNKRWYSLITSPHFRKSFIESRMNQRDVDISIMFKSSIKTYEVPLYKLPSKHECSSSEPYDLSFMADWGDLEIKTSCGDLLLVCRGGYFPRLSRHYYICNSLTKEWFGLPDIPFIDEFKNRYLNFCLTGSYGYALVFDPHHQNRYLVLVIYKSRFQHGWFMFKAAIFDSAVAEWSVRVFRIPYDVPELYAVAICPLEVVGLTNNRMLHWVDGGISELCGVVAFDPFSSHFRLIPLPSAHLFRGIRTGFSKDKVRLGIVRGRLRISLMLKTSELCFGLRVWELENDDSWRLVHDLTVDAWGVAIDRMLFFFVLTFDPTDGNVIFLVRDREIYRYDIGLDVHYRICEFPIQCCGDSTRSIEEIKKEMVRQMYVLTSVHPVWPTSIASLQRRHN